MDLDLTKRQQEIFDFIKRHSAKYGYPPTVRDIGKAVGLAVLQLLVSITAQVIVTADGAMMKSAADGAGAGMLAQLSTYFAVVVFFLMMSVVVVGFDLHDHVQVVLEVEKPAGWIAAAVGGHHQVVVSVPLVDQRRGPLGTRVAPGGGEQQHRRALPVVALLAVGFAVSVDVLLTERGDPHQPIFCASSTMIPAGPRT